MIKTRIMKFLKLLILVSAPLFFTQAMYAQSKLTAKADIEFENGGYNQAAKSYQLVLPNIKDLTEKGRVLFQVAECFRLQTDYTKSFEWYDKAITAQYYKTDPEVYFNYGLALQEAEKWEEAQVQYNKYLEKGGEKSKTNSRIQACKDAAQKKNGKTRLIVENIGEINSPFFDYCLTYASKKNDELVFSSTRQAATGGTEDPKTGESFADVFFAERDKKGKFSVPQPITGNVNTPSHEGACAFDKDFGVMFYTLCKYTADERFACDLMYSERSGKGWGEPVVMNIIDRAADDTSMIGQPALTPDQKFLIFASDMPGGKGGKDLWYITINMKGMTWGEPKNLSAINTTGDDMFPFVADDGTLYFASNGHPGLGGMDIFKAEKTGDLSYASPTNMGHPINSSSDDFYLVPEKGNSQIKFSGFFTSNRPGGKGKDDIYYFKEPPLEFAIIGTVYDDKTGTPIQGATVNVIGSDGNTYKLSTDGNGGFSLDKDKVASNVNYTLDVAKEGFIGTGDKISTVNLKESTTFAKEYFIKPIIIGGEVEMPEVRYDYNKAELQVNNEVNSKDSLNYLYDILMKNPNFVVELDAHTDARGDAKYNQDLSQRRAQSCVDYLVKEKGIPADRIVAKGMGENEPRKLDRDKGPFKAGEVLTEAYINALSSEELKEKAHQLNRRTVFKILRTDYKTK